MTKTRTHISERVIVVRNLEKSFGDKPVLEDIDLDLLRGENLAILGKSGAGKSVLIKCIVRLVEPDSGTIYVLGKNILQSDESELTGIRQKIGFLFQGAALYDSMTIRENLLFPLKRNQTQLPEEEIQSLIDEALENVGLSDAVDKMPGELSGGMKKRAGLARTLILKPQIILYDEPTTGLDPYTAQEIIELIVEIQKKYQASSIIVTHDMKCAKITSNRMHVMHNGKFIAEGRFEELKNQDNLEVKDFFI